MASCSCINEGRVRIRLGTTSWLTCDRQTQCQKQPASTKLYEVAYIKKLIADTKASMGRHHIWQN
eukprot:3751961-Karenia_brevis.AAC.1